MSQTLKSFAIGNRSIGPDYPPLVIAEMSGNHNQSLDRALQIVELLQPLELMPSNYKLTQPTPLPCLAEVVILKLTTAVVFGLRKSPRPLC